MIFILALPEGHITQTLRDLEFVEPMPKGLTHAERLAAVTYVITQ